MSALDAVTERALRARIEHALREDLEHGSSLLVRVVGAAWLAAPESVHIDPEDDTINPAQALCDVFYALCGAELVDGDELSTWLIMVGEESAVPS